MLTICLYAINMFYMMDGVDIGFRELYVIYRWLNIIYKGLGIYTICGGGDITF